MMDKRISVYGYDGYFDQDNKGRSFDDILLAATTEQDVCGLIFRSLKRNKSNALPKSLPSVANVNYIDLTSCHLTMIPESLLHMEALKVLTIAKNDISSLPQNWENLSGTLHELNLSDNPLGSLGQSIGQLKSLEVLNLADCSLSSFAACLTKLEMLRYLNVNGNKIAMLPSTVALLENLSILNASGCGFVGVPSVLSKLPNLTELDLSHNTLTGLPTQLPQALPNVQTLHLCNCGFSFFPEPLFHMKKLNKLDLSRNPISYIPNPLMKSSLYSLTMRHCNLTDFGESISSLHHLDIRDNEIKTISENAAMDLFENCKTVLFDRDYLQTPPAEILDIGPSAVRSYFKDLRLETALYTKIQSVFILGESGSGKTSLALTLASGGTRLTSRGERTIICDNHVFEFERSVHFHITDLGGHSSYEIMYPVLMKHKSSIAVVTVDLSTFRRKKSEQQLTMWLQMCIQNLDHTSNVIVVGTKADLCKDIPRKAMQILRVLEDWKRGEEVCVEKMLAKSSSTLLEDQRSLLLKMKSQLSRINCSLCITSSYKYSGISAFTDQLLNTTGQHGTVLPKAWVDIYKFFTEKTGSFDSLYLPTGDVLEIINSQLKARFKRRRLSTHNTSNEKPQGTPESCLRFFHNRGIILWYENHQRLKNIIIFRPTSIYDSMKLVFESNLASSLLTKSPLAPFKDLTSQHDARDKLLKCGVASGQLLQCLFQRSGPRILDPIIVLEILQMLGYCYEMTTIYPNLSTSYYFPWLVTDKSCPSVIPQWNETIPPEFLQLQCHFEFFQRIPSSLFEQLLVKVYCSLYPGQDMETTANSARCIQNGVDILIEKKVTCNESTKLEELVIKMRSGKTDQLELFKMFTKTACDVLDILKHCPCIIQDQYMVCPHCLLTGDGSVQTSTHLPIDNITMVMREHLRIAMRSAQCHGTSVPAALHFPQLIAFGGSEHHIQSVQSYCKEIARDLEQGFFKDELLRRLSKFIASESKLYDIGLFVGLRNHHIEEVRTDNQNSIKQAAFNMLLTWRKIFFKSLEDEEQMLQKLKKACKIAGILSHVVKDIPELAREFQRHS